MGDAFDIDPTRGDIGGHEHVHLAAAESTQGLFTCALPEVTVHGRDREAAVGEFVSNLLAGALGANEHDRQPTTVGLQHAGEQFHLVHRVGLPHVLFDGLDGGIVVVGINGSDVGGLGHVAPCQIEDLPGHRRREQHGLAAGWHLRHDRFDVG